MYDIIEKFSVDGVLNKLNIDNFDKIFDFLKNENCPCLEDIVTDYLDLFTIEYEEFVRIYNELNKKYNNNFLTLVNDDMNLLEEFFNY